MSTLLPRSRFPPDLDTRSDYVALSSGELRAGYDTFSAGIAQYPDDGLTAHALYLVADRALYAAKAAGKNQVHSAL